MDKKYFTTNFLGSFPSFENCPHSKLPEYAFIGRSNVGKSSLINAFINQQRLTKTSGTPGKTKLINLFEVDKQWIIADLPGYGYSKTSKSIRNQFPIMIKSYLTSRLNLYNTFLLIDIKIPPQKNDLEFLEWLGVSQIPFSIIYTKCDKLTETKIKKNIAVYKSVLLENWEFLPDIYLTSSVSKRGCDELINKIFSFNRLVATKNN